MLMSTARVFLLTSQHDLFDFSSLLALASKGWISFFYVVGVWSVPNQRNWGGWVFP